LQDDLISAYLGRNYVSKGPLEIAKALGVLKAYSLISVRSDKRFVLHQLVRIVMHRYLNQENKINQIVYETHMALVVGIRDVISFPGWGINFPLKLLAVDLMKPAYRAYTHLPLLSVLFLMQ
jgi:hypothetical protein